MGQKKKKSVSDHMAIKIRVCKSALIFIFTLYHTISVLAKTFSEGIAYLITVACEFTEVWKSEHVPF